MTTNEHTGTTAAALFERIWSALASVLGTPATAVLVRRAVKGASARETPHPSLEEVVIVREDLEYRYVLPSSWSRDEGESVAALEQLVEEHLAPLLAELTGPVGLRLLERIPELDHRVRLSRQEGLR